MRPFRLTLPDREDPGQVDMTRGILVLLITASVSASPLDPLTARLEGAAFLSGSFVQTDAWALTLEEETSTGTVFLAPPNLFLFEYSDPPGKRMGFDGENLYTVDALFEQVILYEGSAPGSFMNMLERCSDTTLVCSVEYGGDSVIVSLSGDLGEGISTMVVGYTMSDSLPWLFRTTDINNNVTSYSIREIEIQAVGPEAFFTMVVPEGFELIDSGDI
jgi:outer membrane lipoprotein-sorting protein